MHSFVASVPAPAAVVHFILPSYWVLFVLHPLFALMMLFAMDPTIRTPNGQVAEFGTGHELKNQ